MRQQKAQHFAVNDFLCFIFLLLYYTLNICIVNRSAKPRSVKAETSFAQVINKLTGVYRWLATGERCKHTSVIGQNKKWGEKQQINDLMFINTIDNAHIDLYRVAQCKQAGRDKSLKCGGLSQEPPAF